MSRSVARISVLAAFVVGVNLHAAVAGPASNMKTGGGGESKLSNPVTLQQRAGLDPTLALDARSGALYVAWARPTSGAETGFRIASDGTVYVAWLDDRERLARSELPEDQRPEDVEWQDSDDPKVQVRVARAGRGDLRFGPSVLVADSASERSRISIATDTKGSLSAAWRSKLDQFKGSYDSVRDILVSTSTDGGMSWSKPVKVHDDRFKAGDCPELTIGTGFDTKGTFHLAWYTGTGVAPGIYYVVSEDRGRSFSQPLALLTGDWVPYADVKLAIDGQDAAWVAFEDRRDDRAERVTVVRIDRQGSLSAPRSWRGSAPDIAARGEAAVLAWTGAGGAIEIVRLTP